MPGVPIYSLRALLGVIALAAMALAWMLAIHSGAPEQTAWTICTGGSLLGLIIGFRRNGSLFARGAATVLFVFGSILLAAYSGWMAAVWQLWRRSPEDQLEVGLAGFGLVLLAPIVLLTAVFMLRAWTWSAYDSLYFRLSRGRREAD